MVQLVRIGAMLDVRQKLVETVRKSKEKEEEEEENEKESVKRPK